MEIHTGLDYVDGQLDKVTAYTVDIVDVRDLLSEGQSEPFVSVEFAGTPTLVGYLTPEAAESLYWLLAEIFSPVSVSKLRLIAASPSKMAEKGEDHAASDDKSPA